jgi:hypothetical protein
VTSHAIVIKCYLLARDRTFLGKTGKLGLMRPVYFVVNKTYYWEMPLTNLDNVKTITGIFPKTK